MRRNRWSTNIYRGVSTGQNGVGQFDSRPRRPRKARENTWSQAHFRILGYVHELAIHFGSKITLLHVVEPGEDARTKEEGAAGLRLVQQDLEAAGVPTDIRERRGDPAMEILDCARDERADLLAMTTPGRSGPSRWVIGSVTEKVLRSAVVPMLVVQNP